MSGIALARNDDEFTAPLLNIEETASLVGISPDTVREYVRFGILTPISRGLEQFLNKADVVRLFGVNQQPPSTSEPPHDHPKSNTASATEPAVDNVDEKEDDSLPLDHVFPSPSTYDLLSANKRLRQEIMDLKDERAWLRTRLEKLEARSEREQMLLLYESENVRTLINTQNHASLWSRTLPLLKAPLEWLKLAPESDKPKTGQK